MVPEAVDLPAAARSVPASDWLDQYVPVEMLGAGGMGAVWKAWDTRLRRWVALKIPSGLSGDDLVRFRREAQIAGRLSHPSIAAVYEVGEDPRRPYIARQFIDGVTLRSLDRANVTLIVRLIRDAARAVAYAHDVGVVHRDLKPDNLMVAGERVYVLDFGLARTSDTRVTMSGAVVGTPGFMPPEQARGDRIDGRVDVWALGATLYNLLAGRPPFAGATAVEIIDRVLREEPVAPRRLNPHVDREIQAIILKCLEKDPARRYASAHALAEDLTRWLEGAPVQARPPSLWRRARRALARHRLAVALTAMAIVLAGSATLWAALRRHQGLLTSAQAELLATMRETYEARLDAALQLRRSGDVAGMQKHAARVEAVCARVTQELPGLAEPHYCRGRMLRAMMRFDEAIAAQDTALKLEPGYAPSRYERGLLRIRRYEALLQERLRDWWERQGRLASGEPGRAPVNPPPRAELEDDIARGWRRGAEEDLAGLDLAIARGLCLWLDGKREEAQALFERATVDTPDIEEAWEWRARAARDAGQITEAAEWYARGREHDRGYAPHIEGHALALLDRGLGSYWAGGEPDRDFADVISDTDDLERLGVATAATFRLRARALLPWAVAIAARGGDPFAKFAEAVDSVTKALELEPQAPAWRRRGHTRLEWGTTLMNRGGDPTEHFRAAIDDLNEAVRRDPHLASAWMSRGITHANTAYFERGRGADPTASYRQAVADLDETLRLNPNLEEAWLRRAQTRDRWGLYLRGLHQDPTSLHEAAVRDGGEVIRRQPGRDDAWVTRGDARSNLGFWLQTLGKDPTPLYASAIADYDEAITRNRSRHETWVHRGNTRLNWGNWDADHDEDPFTRYQAALDDFAQAARVNMQADEPWLRAGMACTQWAWAAKRRGRDPAPHHQGALHYFDEALKRNARDETWMQRGLTQLNLALHISETGGSPSALLESAISDLDRALAINARNPLALRFRGIARAKLGAWRPDRPSAHADYRSAVADLRAAVAINPSFEEALAPLIRACEDELSR